MDFHPNSDRGHRATADGAEYDDFCAAEAKRNPHLVLAFLRDEARLVAIPQNITTVAAYLHANRLGRMVPLNRVTRRETWAAMVKHNLIPNVEG